MRRADVLAILAAHRAEIDAFGVKSLAIFGSVARDEASPNSDIDVLVEFDGTVTFDRYMGLKLYLEDLFGKRVDVATTESLKPRIRPAVQREAIRVA